MVKIYETQKKDIVRLIQNTKGRFFSLVAIIIIGVAFFVGVSGSSYIMGKNVDAYTDDTNLKDITIYSNYGFDDEDVDAISQMSKVDKAEGSKFVDVLASNSRMSKVTRVHSYDANNEINQLADLFEIGDEISLSRPEHDLSDFLSVEKVKVVGLVDTPLYINETKETSTLSNQYIATYMYIPSDAFSMDYFTEINVLTKQGKSLYAFSDAYKDYCAEVKEDIQDLGIVQSKHRRDTIIEQAKEKYQEGYEEYKDALREFNDGIKDGEKQLEDAEDELTSGKEQLASGKQTLIDSQNTLNEQISLNQATLDEKQNELNQAKAQLEDGKKQLDEHADEISQAKNLVNIYDTLGSIKSRLPEEDKDLSDDPQYQELLEQLKKFSEFLPPDSNLNDGKILVSTVASMIDKAQAKIIEEAGMSIDEIRAKIKEYDDGLAQYEQGMAQVISGQSQLDAAYQQLEATRSSSQSQIDSGWAEIKNNTSKINEGETSLEEGKQTLEEQRQTGQQKLNEAKEKLDKAKQDIEDLEKAKWTVLDRTQHYGNIFWNCGSDGRNW